MIEDRDNELIFSAVSIWEIAIKYALGKPDFSTDPHRVRQACRDNGLAELAVTSDHGLIVATLPPIHGDLFDRLLVAQAIVEDLTLLTGGQGATRAFGSYRPPCGHRFTNVHNPPVHLPRLAERAMGKLTFT